MPKKDTVNKAKKLAAFRLSESAIKRLKELCEHYENESGFTVSQGEVLERSINQLHVMEGLNK